VSHQIVLLSASSGGSVVGHIAWRSSLGFMVSPTSRPRDFDVCVNSVKPRVRILGRRNGIATFWNEDSAWADCSVSFFARDGLGWSSHLFYRFHDHTALFPYCFEPADIVCNYADRQCYIAMITDDFL